MHIDFSTEARAILPATLLIERSPELEVRIDLANLPWLSFVQVGDDLALVFEGWWLLGQPKGAIAIAAGCSGLDALMRDGVFA